MRPEYVDKPAPTRGTDPWVQTPEIIEAMRIAGRLAAQALQEAGKAVVPGVTTDEIDARGARVPARPRRVPVDAGLPRLPEVVLHVAQRGHLPRHPGLARSIEDGDIVNIDVTAFIGGVHGDTNATFLAGDVSEEARLLVERTHEATMRAIKAVKPGRELNVVGRVIEAYANRFDYGVVRDFTGHGIGRTFHSGLVVLHYDEPSVKTVLEPGMTFTIEPMITLGDYRLRDLGRRLDRHHEGQELDRPVRAHDRRDRERRGDPHSLLISTSSAAATAEGDVAAARWCDSRRSTGQPSSGASAAAAS